MFDTYVYPAKRVKYDGSSIKELSLPEPPDEDWLKYPEGQGVSKEEVLEMIKFKNLFPALVKWVLLTPFKFVSPMWSPMGNTI